MDASACHFSTMVGTVAFIASIGFLIGEWFFEQMSSIKTRKHYVIFDMAFSGLWAFFYFVTFIYMCIAWSKTEEIRFSFASSNIYGAIFFAFLSIFAWLGCAVLAFQRFKAGGQAAFTEGIPEDGTMPDGQYQTYTATEGQYAEPPFNGGEQQVKGLDSRY